MHDAAAIAHLPALLDRSLLQQGNSRIRGLFSLSATAGSSLGAVLLSVLRAARALLADALTVAGWILRRPDTLTETEQLQLKTVRAHCSELDALTRHVRSFAAMLTERQGEHPPDWLDAVRQNDLPSLHTLAAGIDRDRDAVIAGLTLPWSSGVMEGHVNRIKMLKRQMFGRLLPAAEEASPARRMRSGAVR